MIKSALIAIRDNPFSRNRSQLRDSKNLIAKRLNLLIQYSDHENLAEYLSKMFFRAHLDNSGSFWTNRRANIYCALYRPEQKKLAGQAMFLKACLYRVLPHEASKLLEIRHLIIGKRSLKDLYDEIQEYKDEVLSDLECDYLNCRLDSTEFELRNYYLTDEMEDSLDTISGSEDPEEYNVRTWGGSDETHYLLGKKDKGKIYEYTLKNDFRHLKLKSPYGYFQYKWLGYGSFYEEYDDDLGFTWCVSEFPGNSVPPLPLELYPYTKPKMVKLHDIAENIQREEKSEGKITEKTNIQGVLTSDMTDDEIFDYQVQVLKNNGIQNPEFYSKFFFKKSDVSNVDNFWNNLFRKFDFSLIEKKTRYTSLRSERTSALPGFSGVLNDPASSCELRTLFGEHGEQLLMGNHSIGIMSYKHTLRTVKKLFYKVDDNGKALLTIILATLKDAIITDNAESWYLEGIMGILDPLEERLDDLDSRNFVPPRPINANLRYETTNIYSRRRNNR